MEGVFHEATILVDNTPVATHGDGWTGIAVDLTPALNGARSFILGVDARVPDDRDPARRGFGATLAGKQDWYGIHGGPWKPARLEARHPTHLHGCTVVATTDLRDHAIRARGALSTATPATVRVAISAEALASPSEISPWTPTFST